MKEFISKPITSIDFKNASPVNELYWRKKSCEDKADHSLDNYHVNFIGSFTACEGKNYHILISADDYYKLYINGRFVCQGPRSAYVTNYNYNRCDITEYMKDGENEIRVHVYYQGLLNRVWVSGDNKMMLIADIFSDNEHIAGTEIFTRCEKIKGFFGRRIFGYDTQFIEDFDFNSENELVEICECKNIYNFHKKPMAPIDVYTKEFEAEKDGNGYNIDLGQEVVASAYIKLLGNKGQKVRILCGEELENGNVRYEMRCNCLYENILILSGSEDLFEEFDYKAFRYMRIESDFPFRLISAGLNIRHNKFKEIIAINSDNEKLCDIWKLCANTLKYGVQELFLDCPTREKGEYLGDFLVSGLAYLYLTGDSESYKRTLIDFADTSTLHKGLIAIGSSAFTQDVADFSLIFPLIIWNYYKLTKDFATVRELLPVVDDMIKYFAGFERKDGLLQDMTEMWNLIDWPKNLRDDYAEIEDKEGVCHNVLNAHYIGAVITRDRLADAIGEEKSGKAELLIDAFNKEFLNEKTGLYTDMKSTEHSALHSNALPLFYGFAPEDKHSNIAEYIAEKGLCCGVFFSYFVLKGLVRAKRRDDVLKLLCDDRYWLNMINEGATTTFEAWGKEQKWNTSLFHPWACCPVILIAEDFADMIEKK